MAQTTRKHPRMIKKQTVTVLAPYPMATMLTFQECYSFQSLWKQ